jgi:hypothetical protein
MIKAAHSEHNLPDDLIDKLGDIDKTKYAPSNLAIELAARRTILGYEPFSLKPERLKKKLPKSTLPQTATEIPDNHSELD